jgi:glycosyltransferase involved in cell wall biosynthesis
MKVLFCHDGPLKRDEFNNYYGVAHNNATFSRYYTIAENLTVAIRVNKVSKTEAEIKLSKITVSPFDVISCPNLASLKGILFDKRKTEEILKKEITKSDYVVARLPSIIGSLAADTARKLKKPCLIEVVACPWDALWNHSLKGKLTAPFMYYATKRRVKDAAFVLYVTNEFLQYRYPTNGKSVNCSNVALKDFDDAVLEQRLEKAYNLHKDNKLIIGTTAAFDVRYKGQKYIIEALGNLKQRGITNFEYQLVGRGNQNYLQSIAEKNNVTNQIKFLGALRHEQVFDWLDTIDIYAQPSRQEGLPRALIEAMSRGCPAIGAKTGGIPELLEKEYIFSNTRHEVMEICDILLRFNQEKRITQSIRNYEFSKQFEKNLLEQRRKMFFEEFRDFVLFDSTANLADLFI